MSWSEFYSSYQKEWHKCKSYRLGQHFVNLFIVDRTGDLADQLWNLPNDQAVEKIYQIISDLWWNPDELVIIEVKNAG